MKDRYAAKGAIRAVTVHLWEKPYEAVGKGPTNNWTANRTGPGGRSRISPRLKCRSTRDAPTLDDKKTRHCLVASGDTSISYEFFQGVREWHAPCLSILPTVFVGPFRPHR